MSGCGSGGADDSDTRSREKKRRVDAGEEERLEAVFPPLLPLPPSRLSGDSTAHEVQAYVCSALGARSASARELSGGRSARLWSVSLVGPPAGCPPALVARIPIKPSEDVRSEVAIMRALAQRTSIPLPTVIGWSPPSERHRGLILMTLLPGSPLSSVWNTLAATQRQRVLAQLPPFMQQLRAITFSSCGPLDSEMRVIPCPAPAGRPALKPGSMLSFYTTKLTSRADRLRKHRGGRISSLLLDYSAAVLPGICSSYTGALALCHMDLNARNILVDPSSLTVTGIVDWESAGSYPEETDVFKLCRYLMSGGGKERDTFLADVSAACGASPPGAARRQALFDINKLADDIVWPTGVVTTTSPFVASAAPVAAPSASVLTSTSVTPTAVPPPPPRTEDELEDGEEVEEVKAPTLPPSAASASPCMESKFQTRGYKKLPGSYEARVCARRGSAIHAMTPSDELGSLLYTVGEWRGGGGQSILWEGTQAGTGLCVALKEYRSATAVGVASTFDREGHIHRLLGPNCHANICSALDSLVIAGGSYMTAFPFVIGEPLDSVIGRQPGGHFSETDAASLFSQMLSGVHFMHSRSVVHLDIKPLNILVGRQWNDPPSAPARPFFIDFGLSSVYPNPKKVPFTVLRGSKEFMSPEMYAKAECSGVQCDLWALGVTLFFMLLGELPWTVPVSTAPGCAFDILSSKGITGVLLARGVLDTLTPACTDLLEGILAPARHKRLSLEEMMGHKWLTT